MNTKHLYRSLLVGCSIDHPGYFGLMFVQWEEVGHLYYTLLMVEQDNGNQPPFKMSFRMNSLTRMLSSIFTLCCISSSLFDLTCSLSLQDTREYEVSI